MDIHIDARSTSKISVQHLPFNIKHDGPARLAAYFVPKKTTHLYEGKHVLQAAFRGRLLAGLPVTLPAGYTGCVFRDAEQLAHKDGAGDEDELPDPAQSVLEWRLVGTFRELISWQRRTDNQLETDQFVEGAQPSAPLVSDPTAPPAPPAPNMVALSHKSALFNWTRWLDVAHALHAPIAQSQLTRVQQQDLLAATEQRDLLAATGASTSAQRAPDSNAADSPETTSVPEHESGSPESKPEQESGSSKLRASTRKRKHEDTDAAPDEETASPRAKKQRK